MQKVNKQAEQVHFAQILAFFEQKVLVVVGKNENCAVILSILHKDGAKSKVHCTLMMSRVVGGVKGV